MKVARDPRHECCEIAADVLQPFSGLFVAAHRIRILAAMPCGMMGTLLPHPSSGTVARSGVGCVTRTPTCRVLM